MAKESIQVTIGKFIYKERKKQNLTLNELSLLAFKNEANANRIARIEKGLTKQYTVETLDKILNALGFKLRNLFKD
jgi:transcriptional regulator with XRE-family HTH domain